MQTPIARFLSTLLLATLASAATSSQAQTLRGAVDVVDQRSVLGWACLPNQPFNKARVSVQATHMSTGHTFVLFDQIANAERIDVFNSQLCGNTLESRYHGFEHTIHPDAMLQTPGRYVVRAYASGPATTQLLPGIGYIDVRESGLPTSSVWRTDYNDPNQRRVSKVGCIWPYKGANTRTTNEVDDPLFLNAGATIKQGQWQEYPGQTDGPNWCNRNHTYDSASWNWRASNSATNSTSGWPQSNFWVVSANNELAYSKLNSGPPSQSEPINQGGLYAVAMNPSGGFTLAIDNRKPGYRVDGYPFLSLGASMGRGVDGAIAYVPATGADTHLEFSVTQNSQNPGGHHDVAVYIEAMWGGYKRFMGLSLRHPLSHRYHWNWNALESFWFPGGEFNLLGSQTWNQVCAAPGALLPVLSDGTVGQTRNVRVPLRALFQCIENRSWENLHTREDFSDRLGWTAPRPINAPLVITGLQFSVEEGPGRPNDHISVTFTRPRLVSDLSATKD